MPNTPDITVPAEALSGRLTPDSTITSGLLCVFLVVISRWFWKRGLKNYSGASA